MAQPTVRFNSTTEHARQAELYNLQWRDMMNKLTSALLSGHRIQHDEIRKYCRELDNMDFDQRVAHVHKIFGPVMLEKTKPYIEQLATLEKTMINHGNDKK